MKIAHPWQMVICIDTVFEYKRMLKINNEMMGVAAIFCDADVNDEDINTVAKRSRWTFWLPYSLKVIEVKMGTLLEMKQFVDDHLKKAGFMLIEDKHRAFL
jgi:hypothetical protein